MSVNNFYMVYIKLGTACSSCISCEAKDIDVKFNPEILPILKKLDLKLIAFGGGEPFKYWNIIKEIMSYVGNKPTYRFVSSGIVLTQEIVDFLNQYNVLFTLSDNGIGNYSKLVRWDLIKQLKQSGIMVTFSEKNQDIYKSLESLIDLKKKYFTTKPSVWSSFPNFMYCISKFKDSSNQILADSYINQVTELTEKSIQIYKERDKCLTIFLKRAFIDFVKEKKIEGIHCCCSSKIEILADGRICSCPHSYDVVGDIFHLDKLNWEEIKEKYIPSKCKNCKIFNVCGNYCCKDITGNQCYIMKQLNKNIIQLMKKYDIKYDELVQICRENNRKINLI